MKIIYIGNFVPPHSTENHYALSFEALGHEVIRAQEPSSQAGVLRWLRVLTDEVVREQPALLLYTRTWGLPMAPAVALWRAAEEAGAVTAAVHLDRWLGLNREREVLEQPMFRMQHVFTADGDAQQMYRDAGINHHWLSPGVYEGECYDADPDSEWAGRWDVAFVGSAPDRGQGNYHEEWPHRGELVAQLRTVYGDRFVHVGNGGDLANNHDRPNLRGDDLNRFYASVPIIVGDSIFARRDALYWSDRVPETWGRGGFLIHPEITELQNEIGLYPCWEVGDWEGLHKTIRYWLEYERDRWVLRDAIASRVRERCTYTVRALELLQTAGLA